MPKVTPQHLEARRQQILDGARRCFARHGFEETTVRALEQETGLSSGAIFNYFPTKLDLFITLAEQDSLRAAELWLKGGLPAVIEAFGKGRDEPTGSYLELGQRIWLNPKFRAKWAQRGEALEKTIRDSIAEAIRAGRYRTDIPLDVLAEFATIILDGFMLRVRIGGLPPHRETIYALYENAMSGPQPVEPQGRDDVH
jgi:AcrR family transcriptional regulator